MESRRFQVEVISRQRALYEVDAPDAAAAREVALQRWQSGQPSDLVGYETSTLDTVHISEAPDELRQAQDDELLLRFIRERERLLLNLGGDLRNASTNDAISASQAAADLGWYRSAHGQAPVVDSVRAAFALERLCSRKVLVCFERERVRAGERGSIRLYSTPDYLERLTLSMRDGAPSAASV